MAEKGRRNRAGLHVAPVSDDGKQPRSGESVGREPARFNPADDHDDGGMPFTGEDLDRFMEMLERSNPRAFREIVEGDLGWA